MTNTNINIRIDAEVKVLYSDQNYINIIIINTHNKNGIKITNKHPPNDTKSSPNLSFR